MRSKLFLILVVLLICQAEFNGYGSAEEPTSENPLEVTTKKSGFFKGIKKFFGGGSSKTTEAPSTTSTTTTTTPRPTTKPTVRLPPQQHYPQDLPGFPPRQQPQPNKPGLTALSYPATKPPANLPTQPSLAPMQPITSSTTTTTTTRKPTIKVEIHPTPSSTTTTTTRKPTTKDDFPTLPTKKSAVQPSPASLPAPAQNAWSTTPSSPIANKVSFITTPKSNLPTPSTTHRPAHSPSHAGPGSPSVPTTAKSPGTEKSLVTDAELSTVSEQIFAKETNSKLNNLHLDLQGKTKSHETKDEAPKPLFNPDDQALRSNSIIKMMALFNNYELDTTVNEYVTPMERSEENQFLDIIMVSGVMRQTMLFLQNKGLVSPDPAKHRELVKTIWFTMYSRGLGKIGSSAFEHVFLNEIKNGTVIGLHNWVYFLEQEKAGKVDYMGYIKKVDLGNKAMVVVSRFSYDGIMKPYNGMFVGTSPELEVALYTLCFVLRPDQDCPLTLGGQKVNIVTFTWKYRGNKLIGSAYPEI